MPTPSAATINRNDAFYINTEKFGLRKKTVYNLVNIYGLITSHQIAEKMKLGINQVSGRITELKDEFLIIEAGSVLNRKTKVHNTLWRVTTKDERTNLVNKRYQELVNETKQLENDFHLGISEYGLKAIKKQSKKINKQIVERRSLW